MKRPQAVKIELTEKQKQILDKIARGSHTPLHLIERAQIILMANEGTENLVIARHYDIARSTVKLWRKKWAMMSEELNKVENERPHALKTTIESVLSDEQRPGRPSRFTDEEVAHILSLACQSPSSLGLPFSHWTPSLLAKQAMVQGIVESISTRSVGRFLKGKRLKTPFVERMAQS